MKQITSQGIFFLLLIFFFLPQVRSQDQRCRIVDVKEALPADFDRLMPVEGYDYDLSPSHHYILMQFRAEPENTNIGLYEVVESGLKEKAMLEDAAFLRGAPWSHDETKVLLQGALNQQLYLYHIADNTLMPLTAHLRPGLEIYQAIWMLDDQGILFVAIERPFPTTDYGLNEVVALYRMDLGTLDVTPVSQPNEQVDWYFYTFLALSQTQIVYSSCSIDGENLCHLKIVSAEETRVIDGDYKVLDALSDDEVLVQLKRVDNEGEAEFDLFILSVETRALTPLMTLTDILDVPIPVLRLSPNRKALTYMADETTLMLFDLEQKTSLVLASVDDPDREVGDWLPSGNELMYRTNDTVFLYHDSTDSHDIIRDHVQDDDDFLWLCR